MRNATGQTLLVLCLYALLGVAAYGDVLGHFFLSDDFEQIGRVLDGDLSFVWGRSHGGFFRPVFILSYYLDAVLWGRNPFGFHLTNLLLHVLNSLLVYALARALTVDAPLTETRRKLVSILAGLIFLLHPSHTEAVSWVSGRADLLATLFCLASLLAYISYLHTGRRAQLSVALCAFAAALLSKEAAVCLPLVVWVMGAYLSRVHNGGGGGVRATLVRALKTAAPFLSILVVYAVMRALMLGSLVGGYGAERHLDFTHSVVVSQLLRLCLRAALPAVTLRSLTFLESRMLSPVLICIGVALLIATAVVLARARRRRAVAEFARRNKFLWVLWALFVCAMLPAVNLRINVFDTQGERFLYLPTVFSSAALAYALAKSARSMRLFVLFSLTLLCFYTVALRITNRHWGEAAEVSRGITEAVARLATRETAVVVNVPDNLRGVHLFRNGIEYAVTRFAAHAGSVKRVAVVAFQDLKTPLDRVEISTGDDALALRLMEAQAVFVKFNPSPECVEVISRTEKELRLRLTNCAARPDIFYFSDGKLVPFAL
ncbi:MAG TPA: hypothetical protein VGV59_13395 [Pyrinomonadaceae bacterium]|nr:hypothetical protein [Pyrinomonadaceae bacterium]